MILSQTSECVKVSKRVCVCVFVSFIQFFSVHRLIHCNVPGNESERKGGHVKFARVNQIWFTFLLPSSLIYPSIPSFLLFPLSFPSLSIIQKFQMDPFSFERKKRFHSTQQVTHKLKFISYLACIKYQFFQGSFLPWPK